MLVRRFFHASSGHSERRIVHFDRPVIYSVVADVASYQSYLPWCTSSRILHRFGPNKFDAELRVGFQLFDASYVSRVELHPDTAILVTAHSGPLMRRLTNSWRFEEGPTPGTTLVSFEVTFEFRNSLHSSAAKIFFQEAHKKMLGAFLKRAEDLQKQARGGVNGKQ